MYLVDTSVWIDGFRRPPRVDLESTIGIEAVVKCLPVLQEVLQAFRDDRAFRVARDAMLAFPIVEAPLETVVFEGAVDLFRLAEARRRHGEIERRLSKRGLHGEKRPHRAAPRSRLRPTRPDRPGARTQRRTWLSRRGGRRPR